MKRLEKLRNYLKSINCDSALLTSFPSIFYYSGFTSEDAYLYITQNEQYIITDTRYTIQAKLESPAFTLVDGYSSVYEFIKPLAEKENIKSVAFEDLHLTVSAYNLLKESTTFSEYLPLKTKITQLRRKKDLDEIKKISNALKVAENALENTIPYIKPGKTEIEIAAILESNMRKLGAEKTSFSTICASGVRGALPHGSASQKVIENGEMITLDFGCIFEGYCSDITRTFSVGTPSDKQKEIYNTVLAAQLEAEKILKSGLSCKDADFAARSVIEKSGYGKNFGHSLGHGVGIEIHELPNLSPRSETVLAAGDVVTVEPGIYVESFGGVRIEDMVVIGDDKIEILTEFTKELLIF